MASRRALITGISGQDGSYLAELLLDKGYDVHGISRRASVDDPLLARLAVDAERQGRDFRVHACDLSRSEGLDELLAAIRPDEIYNLAAQSHVKASFDSPETTIEVNGLGVLRLLEAMRRLRMDARFFQAASAELFGNPAETPQRETTEFHPRSPYAVAKLYAFWMARSYRECYGMHIGNGILFNHESPRRSEDFVTRKITATLARIRAGSGEILRLGHLEVRRDWGHARDYVDFMWRMLQQPEGDDYVAATGESHTVREFVQLAAGLAGMEIKWEGEGSAEVGRDAENGRVIIGVDPGLYRPLETVTKCGDAAKARARLGWRPEVSFAQLVESMMRSDLERFASP